MERMRRNVYFKDYCIFVGKEQMRFDEVIGLLRQTYWADKRSNEVIRRSIQHSRCYGISDKDHRLVGFGRVITDYATTYYICDIIVDKAHQGMGLGKELMRYIIEDEMLKDLSGMLVTENAHRLYEKFGFVRGGERFMLRVKKSCD